jgi:hypothetical protein
MAAPFISVRVRICNYIMKRVTETHHTTLQYLVWPAGIYFVGVSLYRFRWVIPSVYNEFSENLRSFWRNVSFHLLDKLDTLSY